VIVAATAVAIVAAVATTQATPVGSLPVADAYSATTLLLRRAGASLEQSSLANSLGTLATVGEVPERVRAELKSNEPASALAAKVAVTSEQDSPLINVTATAERPALAERLADTFARELIGYIRRFGVESASRQVRALEGQLTRLDAEITELDQKAEVAGETQRSLLLAQRQSKISQYGVLTEQYQAAASASPTATGLEILQRGTAQPVAQEGFKPPRTRTSRIVLAAGIGLLAGAALALVLERLDTRVRTKPDAEQRFGLPVLTEIPKVSRRQRKELPLATLLRPQTAFADAFRLLAAGIDRQPLTPAVINGSGTGRHPGGETADFRRLCTILVTSPSPVEGKSTVVSNLAAAYSQTGRKVMVLSCDFRRPAIHRMLGVSNQHGLTMLLESDAPGAVLNGHALNAIEGDGSIQVVPSGPPSTRATELLTSKNMRRAIAEARTRADVVLLDSPPLLSASDATLLLSEVDGVLVVGRAGKTTADQAERVAEMLKRLQAPVIGVALNFASTTHAAYAPKPDSIET
jgi:capsular exopolysaccharide synthesis family protein